VVVARPVAGQLAADLDAITPPEELGSVHASLQAIASQMGGNLEEAAAAGGQASEPVLRALVDDVVRDIRDFRQAFATAPATALESGLGAPLEEVERLSARIDQGLADLRDQGVAGITIPEPA
jgi:3-oxoacyl-ACP reductase-like protein